MENEHRSKNNECQGSTIAAYGYLQILVCHICAWIVLMINPEWINNVTDRYTILFLVFRWWKGGGVFSLGWYQAIFVCLFFAAFISDTNHKRHIPYILRALLFKSVFLVHTFVFVRSFVYPAMNACTVEVNKNHIFPDIVIVYIKRLINASNSFEFNLYILAHWALSHPDNRKISTNVFIWIFPNREFSKINIFLKSWIIHTKKNSAFSHIEDFPFRTNHFHFYLKMKVLVVILCVVFGVNGAPFASIDDNRVDGDGETIDLSQYGSNIYRLPSNETGVRVANYNPDVDGANPEELGDYLEGDMMMPQDFGRNGLIAASSHWPNGIVAYEIAGDFCEYNGAHAK